MSRIREAVGPGAEVVPLALHVDYWDQIGWKDRFAQPAFGQRQSWLVRANRRDTVYTPQFFVGGSEARSWPSDLPEKVRRLNATPAVASLRIQAKLTASGTLAVNVAAQSRREPAALYLAVTESGLTSKVTRGENTGTTLSHDHVVRAFLGPISLAGGEAVLARELPLSSTWNAQRVELVAFVMNEQTGDVLQAVAAAGCTGP
jgi:hypothetical protein